MNHFRVFQTRESQTDQDLSSAVFAFSAVCFSVVFPLTETGQIGVNLRFPLKINLGISLVGIFISPVAVLRDDPRLYRTDPAYYHLIINFCRLVVAAAKQGRDHRRRDFALHHYLLPSLVFLYDTCHRQ